MPSLLPPSPFSARPQGGESTKDGEDERTPGLFEGRGLGSRLAAFALDETRSEGLRVVPLCSFIAAYIERRSEYRELVVPAS